MVGGASRGLGFAVAEALAREGASVSIASSNAGVDRRGRRNDLGRRHRRRSATTVDVRNGDQIDGVGAEDHRAVRRHRPAVHQRRRSAGRRGAVVRRCGVAERGRFAAVQHAAHGARGRAVDAGSAAAARSSMSTSSSVKEPIAEPRAVDRACARRSRRWRRRWRIELAADQDPRQPDHSRAASTPIASGSSTRSPARNRASRADQAKAKSIATIPLGRYGEPPEFGRVAAFLLSDAAAYMTGATVQVDGGLIKSVL